jgi:hypothetical protein
MTYQGTVSLFIDVHVYYMLKMNDDENGMSKFKMCGDCNVLIILFYVTIINISTN